MFRLRPWGPIFVQVRLRALDPSPAILLITHDRKLAAGTDVAYPIREDGEAFTAMPEVMQRA